MIVSDIQKCFEWYANLVPPREEKVLCPTRDHFQGRLDTMYRTFLTNNNLKTDVALLTAVIGEIGNNCFDHNLGQWRDVAGCWYSFFVQESSAIVLIADRGQGILSSLRRVRPSLKNDQEAVETAFHRRISGRSPEKRGNGLKFVRGIINGNNERGLYFVSGNGKIFFGGLASRIDKDIISLCRRLSGRGTFAVTLWGFS